jgi:hypothetical protein
MLVLERLQPAQHGVEVGVGDGRGVAHVVAELVVANLVGEFLPLPSQVGFAESAASSELTCRLAKRSD